MLLTKDGITREANNERVQQKLLKAGFVLVGQEPKVIEQPVVEQVEQPTVPKVTRKRARK